MAIENNSPFYFGAGYYGAGFYAGFDINYEAPVFPLTGNGYKIIFYDRGGSKIGEIATEIQKPVLIKGNFELLVTGCGAFKINLSKLPAELSVLTYNYRVDIHLFNDVLPWYSGYILKTQQLGTTEETYSIEGFGYFNQLNDIVIKDDFQNMYVSDIVKYLMVNYVENKTDIVYRASKIEDALYEIQSISWERVTAKEIFNQLAEFMQGYEFGVDSSREFYFRAKSTSIDDEGQLFVGKNINKFIPVADISKIKNKLYIYGGEASGTPPTNYLVTVEDTTSQSLYGLKEAKLTIPSALNIDDAEQWGNYKLSELKDPIQTATIDGIDIFQVKLAAEGYARVTSIDGRYEYQLPIENVKYDFDSNGIRAKIELGDLDIKYNKLQVLLMNKLRDLEQLADQIISQL